MPSVPEKQPVCGLAPESAPIGAQFFQQRQTQHHVSVLTALAGSDVNHHPA